MAVHLAVAATTYFIRWRKNNLDVNRPVSFFFLISCLFLSYRLSSLIHLYLHLHPCHYLYLSPIMLPISYLLLYEDRTLSSFCFSFLCFHIFISISINLVSFLVFLISPFPIYHLIFFLLFFLFVHERCNSFDTHTPSHPCAYSHYSLSSRRDNDLDTKFRRFTTIYPNIYRDDTSRTPSKPRGKFGFKPTFHHMYAGQTQFPLSHNHQLDHFNTSPTRTTTPCTIHQKYRHSRPT